MFDFYFLQGFSGCAPFVDDVSFFYRFIMEGCNINLIVAVDLALSPFRAFRLMMASGIQYLLK